MTIFTTPRFSLPLLAAGQAHKEIFHNEALLFIDFLLHPVVESVARDPAEITPISGRAWLIGGDAMGEWQGREDEIALWSGNGWRFIKPQPLMRITIVQLDSLSYFSNGWQVGAPITAPAGGQNIDAEARLTLQLIIALLQQHGLMEASH